MAITNASRLADFGSGIGTEGAVLQVDNTNNRLGVGTTNPQGMLQVGTSITMHGNAGNIISSGIITATTFSGSGSGLTGVASTDNIITSTASTFTGNVNISGVTTVGIFTSYDAVAISGITTISATTESTSSTTGALIVSGGVGIAKSLSVGGNISAGGTVTYEDVTNVDSVGIITAQSGIELGASGVGGTMTAVGNVEFAGIVTATSFAGDGSSLTGIESWNQQDTWLYGGG
jgi:hypothetical protein